MKEGASTAQGLYQPRTNILVARLVVAVAFLDLFMQFPVIAPFARSLGASASMTGIIVAAYSLTNLGGNITAGFLLDRLGRSAPVQAGLLLTALALLGYVLASSPAHLLAARLAHGLSAAILAPGAFAMIGDASEPGSRMRLMGRSSASIAAAAVIGPLIAASLGNAVSYDAVFLLSASLMLLVFIAFLIASRSASRPLAREDQGPADQREAGRVNYPRLLIAYTAALSMTIGLGGLVAHLPTWLTEQGQSASASGVPFTTFALIGMAIMASPLVSMGEQRGRLLSLVAGLLLISGGMLLLSALQGMVGAVAGMAVFGGGFGLLFPTMTAIVAEAASPKTRGRAFGVFYAVYSLGVVIGSVSSGSLAGIYGDASAAPFLLGMTATLAAVPVIALIERLVRDKAPPE